MTRSCMRSVLEKQMVRRTIGILQQEGATRTALLAAAIALLALTSLPMSNNIGLDHRAGHFRPLRIIA